MKLVTRTDLGWPESASPLQPTGLGVKVHYAGAEVSRDLLDDHGACLRAWQDIRVAHLGDPREGWFDVAYNFGVCPHGWLLEGRGLGHRSGANGNDLLDREHYAVVGLVGDHGLTLPTDAMLGGLRDAVELLRRNGAGFEIKGHRDGFATGCPGLALESWVRAGAPRPGAGPPPGSVLEPFPGTAFFRLGRHSDLVTRTGRRLVEEGCSRFRAVPGPVWSPAHLASYAAFQRLLGFAGPGADGVPGPASWARLHVPAA
ncbi:peptidoglycan-binding protein [Kitasatospora sp. NBC_01539]|uniref:peptidoglycan-binding protein n=1 Tax=Kitasatospora sp. NBC_01539 TaxID=2903577 RepID=UPI0038600B94